MLHYTLEAIANIVGNNAITSKTTIHYIATDSRKIIFPEHTIFFALVTPHNDGHLYIDDACQKGVRYFVVAKNYTVNSSINAIFIQVNNTLQALQTLAIYHRSQFNYPVIGITGSNGKTIVKEWVHQLLQYNYSIVRSPRSYNSQLGVPLSVLQMEKQHNLAIFEAGISTVNEMGKLAAIIQPTIGILTTIGNAHNEGFTNIQEKIKEKLLLFSNTAIIIYNYDTTIPYIDIEKEATTIFSSPKHQLISFGKHANALVQYTYRLQKSESHIQVKYASQIFNFTIPFTNTAAIENAVACITTLLLLSVDEHLIQQRLQQLHSIEMRLQLKKAVNNCYIINDSYSNDINSLTIALQYLQQQAGSTKRTLILSDFSEIKTEDVYIEVAALLQQHAIHHFIAIGNSLQQYKHHFLQQNYSTAFFADTDAFINQSSQNQFNQTYILLKGARSFGFEKIALWLEQQVHQTVLEINLTAMAANLRMYQQQLQQGTQLMAMVKAFSYGSGSIEVARLLQFYKVQYLAVAYADEGIELRKGGISLPIMVLNADEAAFAAIIEYSLEPEIYSLSFYNQFHNYLQQQGISHWPIHIKLNTGMNRLGFDVDEVLTIANLLHQNNTCKVQTVFSHLVASDAVEHNAFTQQQATLFSTACKQLETILGYSFLKHIANTSAISKHTHLQYDMVRLGIGLYGVDSSKHLPLQTVACLKTTIAQIRNIKAGETVGYNRKGVVTRDSKIATIRIGYADGYSRLNSNGVGHVYLHQQYAPVIGNVCMDMTMIDVTDITQASEGDIVEIFGNHISVEAIAKATQTIPYEVLTNISMRVKRVYVQE